MRLVFMGSGDFAVPCLAALLEVGHTIDLVVTQPDRRAGRGGAVRPTPVKVAAEELGLKCKQPTSPRDESFLGQVRVRGLDLGVVVAYGHKLPPELLRIPRLGFINAHASLLPKYRGAAPVPHAILNGESETGVTVFGLVEDWDSGPIFGVARTPIRVDDTAGSVLDRLSVLAGGLLAKVAAALAEDRVQARSQNPSEVTTAPKLHREDGRLSWSLSAYEIDCRVRAFQPWPEAFTMVPGKRGKQCRLHVLGVEKAGEKDEWVRGSEVPGAVLLADPRAGLGIRAGKGEGVRLLRVKPEGRHDMTGAEFVRGSRVKVGQVLQ